MDVEQRALVWLARYGVQAVFGFQVLGIVGLPVPDEFMLTVAGSFARSGKLPLVGTLAAAIGGAVTGITISYLAGRWAGLVALRRVVHIPDDVLQRVQRWFAHSGGWLLTFGYFIPGVRHVTAIAAGSSGLGYGRFAAFAYPGAALWASFFVAAGYVLGDNWRPAFAAIRHNLSLAVVVALLLCAGYLAVTGARRYRERRRRAR
jgi:membrane protein DedA with SNARE-associated domain